MRGIVIFATLCVAVLARSIEKVDSNGIDEPVQVEQVESDELENLRTKRSFGLIGAKILGAKAIGIGAGIVAAKSFGYGGYGYGGYGGYYGSPGYTVVEKHYVQPYYGYGGYGGWGHGGYGGYHGGYSSGYSSGYGYGYSNGYSHGW
ncbi:prisilkin-39-like [Diorhabda carinulata]|uniref:prisilkin-39-like n=1 Tax=Diorhabda carinulata TaxID=1163345 RepID=UPI0025A2529A|nr:prisilkin-39-like [Diorhabda carinulata]